MSSQSLAKIPGFWVKACGSGSSCKKQRASKVHTGERTSIILVHILLILELDHTLWFAQI
jgi:hypothetical protein